MSLTDIRPAANMPRLTAGLMWQPEMGPMLYAAPISANPKAKAMPTTPTLSPATTAVPQPNNTRMNVPTNSAKYLFMGTAPFPTLAAPPRQAMERAPGKPNVRLRDKAHRQTGKGNRPEFGRARGNSQDFPARPPACHPIPQSEKASHQIPEKVI